MSVGSDRMQKPMILGSPAISQFRKFENVELFAQDAAMVIEGAGPAVPNPLKERVQLMNNWLIKRQAVQIDVYLFPMILRSWSDK
ncbi:hypothetical protein GGR53DRAFT_471594 [Hypoxylon sp. FL1150]|nr:hypothetical protein GGR53DRAFT_471594 [Hypoxylon sp. FL1150]